MIIHTPRRRISPRTKRKYRAIKNFLQKALGTSSQGNIYTNSTIEVSVSDIKTKIEGIEQQLNKVSKHCRDLSCLERKVRRQTANLSVCSNLDDKSIGENSKSERDLKNVETKLLYKKTDRQCNRTDEGESAIDNQNHENKNNENMNSTAFDQNLYNFHGKLKRQHNENEKYKFHRHQRKTKSKHETISPVYSTSSFHSFVASKHKKYAELSCSDYHQRGRFESEDTHYIPDPNLHRNRKIVEYDCRNKNKKYEERRKEKRNRRENSELDQDFIEKIIKKQYKPVKVFGRRDSDFSQFSAPVCRDHEFDIKEEIQEGSELCSCCFDEYRKRRHRYIRNNDPSDMRSVCDTRLYSSKKHHHHKYRNRHIDDYNNSAYYDVVPVREKSSPLSRRKLIEDNTMAYQYCKEVPPSPRTRRPRLNLKAQNNAEYGDSLINERYRRRNTPIRYHNYDLASELSLHQRSHENLANIETMSSFQSANLIDEKTNQTNNDTTWNTEITNVTTDKTDKALGEIKDILQSFLIEVKKESIHSDKCNITSKLEGKSFNKTQESDKINTTIIPNSGDNFGTHTAGQSSMAPFLPSFPNPCCYPIIPVCPVNCLQNGYILPNSSFTCTACAKASKENANAEKENSNRSDTNDKINTCNETQELIKEIYKYVSQNPKTPRKDDSNDNDINNHSKNGNRRLDKVILTNTSVGGCSKTSKHDANVGTPYMRCFSKSCEAIGSRMNSDTYYSTNASYSDTILEKLSLEASQSSTDSDTSSDISEKKIHRNKFHKLLHSLRLFKRKKKDVIEEVTESESTIAVNTKHKAKPPFKQHITNYAMHGQEYFHPPPIPGTFCPPHPEGHCSYGQGYPHRPLPPEMYSHCKYPINQFGMPYDHRMPPTCNPMVHPPCPNYDPYNQVPPQVPLCLKEIEVKSIGTQSQRKMSMFSKFAKKVQPTQQDASQQYSIPSPNKPTFWKSLQEKTKQQNSDPLDFSLKTQKQLAQGDMKLRNAMLKKLFYKRNPFSPRNLIVRTLLGKDKSSYGNPPKMYRPRMFI
ncbi:unnamed protein product, partial [Brenthis ino]